VVLAEASELSTSGIARIETGTRRTRPSTLDRIAVALGDPELAKELAQLAGPARAPESPYAERIARRRARRHGRRQRQAAAAKREGRREVVEMLHELEPYVRWSQAYRGHQRYGA
jgi:transcriptional regulator with XRE-family HTH domain